MIRGSRALAGTMSSWRHGTATCREAHSHHQAGPVANACTSLGSLATGVLAAHETWSTFAHQSAPGATIVHRPAMPADYLSVSSKFGGLTDKQLSQGMLPMKFMFAEYVSGQRI